MRQVSLLDLHHAALVVLSFDSSMRAQVCAELLWRAHVADKMVKRLRKLHPQWGDGSLRATAIAQRGTESPPYKADDYISAMAVVLKAMREPSERKYRFCEYPQVCMGCKKV